MTDQHGELDAALERVIDAARAHLAAVRGRPGPRSTTTTSGRRTWRSTTPPSPTTSSCSTRSARSRRGTSSRSTRTRPTSASAPAERRRGRADDPHPRVISVRQRRDYRVPSVAALLRVGRGGPPRGHARRTTSRRRSRRSARRCWSCCRAGDGSLGALDVPELEPLDGVVMVSEVDTPLDLESFDDDDAVGPVRRRPPTTGWSAGSTSTRSWTTDDEEHDSTARAPALEWHAQGRQLRTRRRAARAAARRQYDRPGCGWSTWRRRSMTCRVPSRNSRTRASSQPENSAWIASCAAAVNRSTFDGNRSGAYS